MVLFPNTFSTHNLMKNGVSLLADDELTTSTTMCISAVDPPLIFVQKSNIKNTLWYDA